MYCRNRPNVISNDLKCAGGWGSAPDPAGGPYDAPPDPLIVSGFAPKALAPRPLRRLKADPPSFLGTNLTLRCVYVFASQRCVDATSSRLAATAVLRLRLRNAAPTSLLRASLRRQRCVYVFASQRCVYAPRCDGSAASTSLLRATLRQQRCVTSAILQRCSALRRGSIPI